MKEAIPDFFRPILWSHNFSAIDPDTSPSLLISKAINYGDLRHWHWIVKRYGTETVRRVLTALPDTAIRPQALRLARIIFSIPPTHNALTPRSSQS